MVKAVIILPNLPGRILSLDNSKINVKNFKIKFCLLVSFSLMSSFIQHYNFSSVSLRFFLNWLDTTKTFHTNFMNEKQY